ncbi:immunoglobulin superfamily member 5 [Rana temporaria]|uniref:immunoglobulin superfamily member 5 n=1 Tax=Rana temporaria TaxID=8407 RepID=UPI001AAD09D7|nr:immunoglobulin superfamily member 5 [Rana temporaria]
MRNILVSLQTCHFFLFIDFAFCSDIVQGPQNVTVLAGSDASFICTVKAGWKTISWYLKGTFVASISPTGTVVSDGQIVIQTNTNNITGEFTTEMIIINVQKNNAGTVGCSSLSSLTQEAYLMVQVKGSVQVAGGSSVTVAPNTTVSISCEASEWYPAPTITWNINNTVASTIYYITDFTTGTDDFVSAVSTFTITLMADTNLTCLAKVQALDPPLSTMVTIAVQEQVGTSSGLSQTTIILIAVFASIGGLLLLAVIIALIVIFCCKKKKKATGYQSDIRRAPQRDFSNIRTIDRVSLGEPNFAYTPDLPSAAPSFRSNRSDSAFSETTVTPRSSSSQVVGLERTDNHSKKTRHVTHV